MIVTADELGDYLDEYCRNIGCRFRLGECPSSCPVLACLTTLEKLDLGFGFDTEEEDDDTMD